MHMGKNLLKEILVHGVYSILNWMTGTALHYQAILSSGGVMVVLAASIITVPRYTSRCWNINMVVGIHLITIGNVTEEI